MRPTAQDHHSGRTRVTPTFAWLRKNGRELKLEGATHADCLIECKKAFVWVEGKRDDWLAPSITWDVTRDQLARDLEAVWLLAGDNKNFWLVICHEGQLKHHEEELIAGYRSGTWKAGFPHLPPEVREVFKTKIGTLSWHKIFDQWPECKRACEVAEQG